MNRKKIVALVLASIMALTLFGCSNAGQNNSAQGGDKIVIGGLAPLTGEVAVYGLACTNGANLAFDEINAAGGVLGKQIQYEVLDEKGDSTEAANAYNKLLSQNVAAILGDVTSKPSTAVASLAGPKGIPMISGTATAPAVTTYGDNIFRVCFLDPFQGQTMARFAAQNLSAKKAAVIYDTSNDYSQGLAEAFKTQAESLNLEIVAYEGYGSSDTDFKAQLTNIESAKPDVVFMPDYYNKVSLMAIQARSVGITATFLGADGWDGVLDVVDASNMSAVEGSYFCNHYATDDQSEVVQNFLQSYEKKYNETPKSFSALGYDTAKILAAAIEKAGSTEWSAIVEALKGTDYNGVTGHITFDADGNPIKDVSIITIADGKYTLDSKLTPEQ